jgi:hypothetical protein
MFIYFYLLILKHKETSKTRKNPPKSSKLPQMSRKAKSDEEKLEFEWLGQKKTSQSRNSKDIPSFVNSDNESNNEDDFQNLYSSRAYFDPRTGQTFEFNSNDNGDEYNDFYYMSNMCNYCFREFDNYDILTKHEAVCKRLSHNKQKSDQYSHQANDDKYYSSKNSSFNSSSSSPRSASSPTKGVKPTTSKNSKNEESQRKNSIPKNGEESGSPKWSSSVKFDLNGRSNLSSKFGSYTGIKREKQKNYVYNSKNFK